jgi:hypothetical protein
MKKVVIIILFLIFSTTTSYSQAVDSMALKIIQAHLNLISDYLKKNKEKANTFDMSFVGEGSVRFLTKLTGIPSESSGNFGGQFSPTENDYKRWVLWLSYYKESMIWDNKNKVIIIHREMDAPGW